MTFAISFSLNFSSKSPWCSPVPLKFESYKLQHCKKNCRKLVFCVFTGQILYQIIFRRPHCYEVTLKSLQKSETKIFDQKRFIKNLFKVNEKNNLGVLRIYLIMCKLLTLNKRLQFFASISLFTNHLRHYIIIDHKWKLSTSYIMFCLC